MTVCCNSSARRQVAPPRDRDGGTDGSHRTLKRAALALMRGMRPMAHCDRVKLRVDGSQVS
jgi:hypothetical protein